MSDDTPQPAEKAARLTQTAIARWAAVVCVLYVLSTGPVLKLACKEIIPTKVAYVYVPLGRLTDIPVAKDLMYWYLYELWQLPAVEVPGGYLDCN